MIFRWHCHQIYPHQKVQCSASPSKSFSPNKNQFHVFANNEDNIDEKEAEKELDTIRMPVKLDKRQQSFPEEVVMKQPETSNRTKPKEA